MKFIRNNFINIVEILWLISFFITLTISLSGCESFVEVDVPDSQLTGESVFQDKATAEAALVNIYGRFRNNVLVTGDLNGLSILLGNYGDELTYYSNGSLPEEAFFKNNLLPSNTTVTGTWNDSYNLVFAANAVLEGVDRSTGISQNDKNQLKGEALFVRSYIHFYLLNLFGEIPYITSTAYQVNAKAKKLSPEILYPLLITDLKTAETLLAENYIGGERVRPNRTAAKAFLARVQLYANNWEAAETASNLVINNTATYALEEDLDKVFLKNGTSTLWQLKPQGDGQNTLEGQNFIFVSGPPPNRALTMDLINAFETGDQRKNHWIGTVSDGTQNWYYPNKYKQNNNTGSSAEYSILFRLEEVYLIRAEARAQQGNSTGAKEDLNKIRNRAGLANTTANTKQEILEAILRERRVELFTEQGQRWFDLKRSGQSNYVLSAIKLGWNPTDLLWPLPETELLLNSNLLPQNPGY
jgi:hypothetical protein